MLLCNSVALPCRIELRAVEKMLTAQSDDRVVMRESRKERRDGDVPFALDLGECLECADVILNCFNAVVAAVAPAPFVQYADDVAK